LYPQHFAVPFASSAHECELATAASLVVIATALASPLTLTGVAELVVAPLPN
jgi:hypothetical protein